MYNENNQVVGFEIIVPSGDIVETGYYVKNIQNDIIKIVDSLGNVIDEYICDAFGNCINEAGLTSLGSENPFRYKS